MAAILATAACALAACGGSESGGEREAKADAKAATAAPEPRFSDPGTIDNRYLPIRDDAFEDGELIERTHDYFAQADDGTVYYLGEDVVNLRDGRIVDRSGTWLYGEDTDVLGVATPAHPKVGDRYRFEDVPAITTESNRVEESGLRTLVGGRLHTDVIRIQEFIQPESEIEYKLYAPGVGKIVEYAPDGRSELAGCR